MKNTKANLLLIDGSSDNNLFRLIKDALHGIADLTQVDAATAIEQSRTNSYDLIIIDSVFVKNIALLIKRLRAQTNEAKIVVITQNPTWRRAREAFYAGAMDYFKINEDPKEVLSLINKLLSTISFNRNNERS